MVGALAASVFSTTCAKTSRPVTVAIRPQAPDVANRREPDSIARVAPTNDDVFLLDAAVGSAQVISGLPSIGCELLDRWAMDPAFVARLSLAPDLTEYYPYHIFLVVHHRSGVCWTRLAECRRLTFRGARNTEQAQCDGILFELRIFEQRFELLRNGELIGNRSFRGAIGSAAQYVESFPQPRASRSQRGAADRSPERVDVQPGR